MNRSAKKNLIRRWGLVLGGVALLLILYVLALGLAEKLCGGPHTVLAGESHGFKIGMTKNAVLEKYKSLNETVNLRTIAIRGGDGSPVVLERSELQLTPEFELSDHWMAYRDKFPIWFQDFYFAVLSFIVYRIQRASLFQGLLSPAVAKAVAGNPGRRQGHFGPAISIPMWFQSAVAS